MADVKWIKITTDIFDDEKILLIESLPDSYAIITVWFKLLCLAGKMNNSGVFMMSNQIAYTDKMLATIFRMKESTVTLALQTFENFGMVEIIDGVITIPNWGKHQNLDQMENRKEFMRNYMKEYRAKQKALTSGDSDSKSNSKPNSKPNVRQADKEEDKEEDKDKDKKKKRNTDPFLVYKDSDPELYQALKDYESMRKQMKKPMTDRSKSMLLSKLGGFHDEEWIPMLNEAINRNWMSVYPLNDNTKPIRQPNFRKQSKADELDDAYNMMALWAEEGGS